MKSTLAKQILTPVRRSGRIEKCKSKLPSVLRSHVPTLSSPSEMRQETKDGHVYCLPNLNVNCKWNDVWNDEHEAEDARTDEHEMSF